MFEPPAGFEPLRLATGSQQIAALRYRSANGANPRRVLCLHGWLDNANSFVPIAPHLDNVDLVAIDLPGHGMSDHSPPGQAGNYAPASMMLCAFDVISALGWNTCHLMGHSLGACIAPMLAAADSEMISSLTLIDALGPLTEAAERYPARLQRVVTDHRQPQRYASRHFDSHDAAIEARQRAAGIEWNAARLIVARQVVADGDGFRWRFDPALRMASAHYLTEPQVLALLASITCPILSIIADHGFPAARKETGARLASLQSGHVEHLAGQHHVHMEAPEEVAAVINRYFGKGVPAR